jgi:hypothetical protein
MTMGGARLVDWGMEGTGLGCTAPLSLLGEADVRFLRSLADRLDREVGFTRETPPRVRGVHHLGREVIGLLRESVLPRLCAEAGEELRPHPSAHFGCSFNRTQDSGEGYADPWHLDAAAYTAIVLLSSPSAEGGGELCLYRAEPEDLWHRLDAGVGAAPDFVHVVPFHRVGDVVLFQGRRLAHAVRALRGRFAERLTLALGLYVPGHRERGLAHGREVSAADEEEFWRVERIRTEVLVSLERLRKRVAWVDDPAQLTEARLDLDQLREILAGEVRGALPRER